LKTFRVVYALNYDVEAKDEEQALEKAAEKLEREFGADFATVVLKQFGTNVEEL